MKFGTFRLKTPLQLSLNDMLHLPFPVPMVALTARTRAGTLRKRRRADGRGNAHPRNAAGCERVARAGRGAAFRALAQPEKVVRRSTSSRDVLPLYRLLLQDARVERDREAIAVAVCYYAINERGAFRRALADSYLIQEDKSRFWERLLSLQSEFTSQQPK